MTDDDAPGKAYDGRLMRRFARYLRPYRNRVAAAFALLWIHVVADLAGPLIVMFAVDGPITRGDPRELALWTALFAGMVAVMGLFEYLYAWVTSVVGQSVLFDLRMQVFGHLQRLPLSYYDRNPVGRLVVRVTTDVETLAELFKTGLVETAADLLKLGGLVIAMFVLDWRLALVTLSVAPVAVWVMVRFRKRARESYREMRRCHAAVNAGLTESVNGMRTIQIFGREQAWMERFRTLNGEYRESTISAIHTFSRFYPAIEFLSWAAMGLLVWYSGGRMLEGSLTAGSFMAFWWWTHKAFHPIRELAEKYNVLQSAMASSERIFKILDTPLPEEAPRAEPPPPRGEVAFENVSFSYDGRTPVLEDLSFRVESGKTLAIVGLTGAGKTTIINLLLGFYGGFEGTIRVDGADLRTLDIRSVRRRMGLVLQDVFIFGGTIEENIRLGDPSISRERVEAASRAVHADGFIRKLPRGYETDILERGAALSMGERQILSFARALAFDPRILILDEATSSVDAGTERLIQQGLERLLEGRTSIVIAHRLSTIRRADRILVLHKGRVREEGTHAELLRAEGLYRKLHRLQFQPAAGAP